MKLAGAAAARYFARPEPDRAGLLIYGADTMRVALRRQEVVAALIGPEGEAEMRLTRIAAAELRKDPALLSDAVKAQGFFPGPRVALVEDATDGLSQVIGGALSDWRAGDAAIIVTASGTLGVRSSLRTLFEQQPNAYAVGIYDDPPSREEIEAVLNRAGLKDLGRDAIAELTTLARDLDPGDFRQTIEKIALYKHGDPSPLTPAEIELCTPATIEAGIDDALDAVAEARAELVGSLVQRLAGQGVNPVALCIAATRHFRTLHLIAADPAGAAAAIARARPMIPYKRRDSLQRQVQAWGLMKLEEAISILVDTDLTLRSSSRAPAMAVMERALLRLAMKGRPR